MRTKIEIKNRITGKILFEFETENNSVKKTVEEAVRQSANLRYADLQYADLQFANLRYADLQYANLQSANLQSANLRYADLQYADLQSANLQYADLQSANLQSANLQSANLSVIKSDMFTVLLYGKKEVPFLRQNIIVGNIDGSTYNGECACLSGTLMNGVKLHNGTEKPKFEKLIIDCRNSHRPIERFFLGIEKGDTPENNPCSKIALGWVDEFLALIEP